MNCKTILIILSSLSLGYTVSTEYAIGLNDKVGYLGLISKSWIQEKENHESYFVLGGIGLTGALGYGYKYYLLKGDFAPYVSLTGFAWYVAAIGAVGSPMSATASIGADITAINWKNNAIKLQFGIISMYDIANNQSITIDGENGPPGIMPSFNIKVYFGK